MVNMIKIMDSIINQIRDILRKEGITGMDSINHCIAFLVCRMLDEKMCEKVGISKTLAFNNLIQDDNGNELGDHELYNKFFMKGNKKLNFVGELVNKLGFKNIKFKMEGIQNLKSIVNKLKGLNINNLETTFDLIGTVYEIHLKSGTSNAMRDLGQYYTHRLVIKYMIELCEPKMKNSIIEKIVDPTMGTGGFLTMSIKYLNNKYKNIDWKKNKDNIIGFDIDDNVKNMALLNVFLEIGELANETIVKQDTLHNDMKFPHNGTILQKADVILANEPMGLKNIIHSSCCERIKDIKIRGTKAEPLFMQLFMEALNDDGRCAVVVPDGVLFNESELHKKTRRHLIENFNLKKVVALNDKNFFLNTGVKTSILFFAKEIDNTTIVDFCEITINDNNEIDETSVIKVKYDEIVKNNYSLSVNKYNTIPVDKIKGIAYEKLENVCQYIKTGKNKPGDNKTGTKYPYYGTSGITGYTDEFLFDDELILTPRNGTIGTLFLVSGKIFPSDHVFVIKPTELIKINYLYYYLKFFGNIDSNKHGSTIPNITLSDLKKIEIPIPSMQTQDIIVEQLDVLHENNKLALKNIEGYKKIIKYYIDCHTKNDTDEKIGDICDTQSGDYIKSADFVKGKYPLYGGGDISNYINIKNRQNTLVIAKDGVSEKCVRFVSGEFFLNHHGWTLNYKNNNIQYDKYIYYWLWSNQHKLYNLASGSAQKGINRTSFYNLNIKIPSLEKQQELITYCDNLNDIICKMENQISENNKLMNAILQHYLDANIKLVKTDISKKNKKIKIDRKNVVIVND